MSFSLRRRIFLGTTVTLAGVVLIGGVAVWLGARALLYGGLDRELHDRARDLAAAGQRRPPGDGRGLPPQRPGDQGRPPLRPGDQDRPPPRPEDQDRPPPRPVDQDRLPPGLPPQGQQRGIPPEFRAEGGTHMLEVVNGAGVQVAHSPSLPDGISLWSLLPAPRAFGPISVAYLPDGRALRLIAQPLPPTMGRPPLPPWLGPLGDQPPGGDGPRSLVLAIDATAAASDLTRLGWALAALWVFSTGLGALVAGWLHRAVLRPVTRISQAIAEVDELKLQTRMAMDEVPEEMHVILERLNALLARLDAAFARERGTIASIAHELRTPVAGLLMTVELALARDQSQPQTEALRKCLRIAGSMQAMIGNLLILARVEAGQLTLNRQPVVLVPLVESCWEVLADRARERRLTLSWHERDHLAPAHAAEEQVRMVVTNLLDNAVTYAPIGSAIAVGVTATVAGIRLTITNPTDGTLTDTTAVFEPFWRGDAARTAGLHCGLGLALVQRLVVLMGGTARADLDGERNFTLTLVLPAVPPA